MAKLIVMIPAKNEEQGIRETILKVKREIAPNKIVVVDANSSDSTVKIAKKAGAEVLLQNGVGKGAGIITFIEKNQKYPGDAVVIMTDADSTYGLSAVKGVLPLLNNYGMLVGSRFRGKIEKGALAKFNRFGNVMFSFVSSVLFLAKITDLLSGLRIFRMDALRKMGLSAQGFDTETEMTLKCLKKGLGYFEFPCDYYKRLGKSNLKPLKDGWLILKRIIIERFRF